jgi:glycosyltransferase involved in cell wall biosynthesis
MPDRWSPYDASLLADVPEHIQMLRAQGRPHESSPWRERAARWLRLESAWSEWWVREAVACGRQVEDVDVIYAIMPPYVTADAAARLARELGKPWIADLGDPWALDEMAIYPTALHRQLEIRRMRRLLGSAAAIVMTTPEAVSRVQSTFPELAHRIVVSIPMAYDGRDFASPVPQRGDGSFRIVHSGSFHTDLAREQHSWPRRILRGGFEGVDIGTRSHVYLLAAVERLLAQDLGLAQRIEVHLAGVLSATDRELASRIPVVRTHGYLPHAETIDLIRSADLLFLPLQNLSHGRRSATVPGKTYEYLATQRPILAAVPEGDARDILLRAGTGRICSPADVNALAEAIRLEVKGEAEPTTPDLLLISSFEYGAVTEQVARLIEQVSSGRG